MALKCLLVKIYFPARQLSYVVNVYKIKENTVTYMHLPGWHEVCTLSNPLKYFLQLWVNEAIIY